MNVLSALNFATTTPGQNAQHILYIVNWVVFIGLMAAFGYIFWVQNNMRTVHAKYENVYSTINAPAWWVAKSMLTDYGITNVIVKQGRPGQNFFNPQDNSITLDNKFYNSYSIAAIAIIAHECGHAIQKHKNNKIITLLDKMNPMVQIANMMFLMLWFISIFFATTATLYIVLVAVYIPIFAFNSLKLPLEYNASKTAGKYIKKKQLVDPTQQIGVRETLKWAWLTYFANWLISFFILAIVAVNMSVALIYVGL